MQHESVVIFARQCIDGLRITARTQRGDHQGLRLAAGEQGRAMRARQHAGTNGDRTHGTGIATVNTRRPFQDPAPYHLGLQVVKLGLDRIRRLGIHTRGNHLRKDASTQRLYRILTGLLFANRIGTGELITANRLHLLDHGGRRHRRLPIPQILTAFIHHLVDGINGDLHLVMTKHQCPQHDLFGELVGLGLNHQHGDIGAGHDQVKRGILQIGQIWVEDILTVDIAHARRAHRAIERDSGQRHGGRSAQQRRNIRRDIRVLRQHRRDDLNLVVETVRKERPQRTINQARNQDLAFRLPTLAAKEAARDAASRIRLFLIIHGQGEEILTGFDITLARHGDQHHGVSTVHHHGAIGLTSNLAGLQGHLMLAVLEGLSDN